ncbi:O-antigen ligase family protein [Clostridium sp. YIM B02505]|uniref:O-antigen ligase family protein n=1 Tax=Clostridium yunnanense TaxID=2800325 RepID=A0ABS1EX48_9CLOT|nr:O-antigen ligase family protein [Clostridium yunnanense]MBK1813873.1 O-antigen ligase family protein [Clostridium yunnanense]
MKSKNQLEKKNSFKDYYLCLMFSIVAIMPYSVLTNEVILSLSFVILGGTCIYYIIRNQSSFKISNLEFFIVSIIAISVFCSILKSSDKVLSSINSIYVFICIITYFYISRNVSIEKYIIKAMIITGGIYSALSIIVNLTNPYNRLEGLFNYANSSAVFLAVCSILYFYNCNWLLQENYGKLFKVVNLIIISALFATESRGGILVYLLALFIGKKREVNHKLNLNILGLLLALLIVKKLMLVYFLLLPIIVYLMGFIDFSNIKLIKNKVKNLQVIKNILVLLGFVYIVYYFFRRILEISITNSQLQERMVFIFDGLEILKKNIFGIGAGQYNKLQFIYQSANYDTKYVHNGFIQIGLDYGILALSVFVITLLYTIYIQIKKRKSNQWLIIMTMIVIHSMFDFSLSFMLIGIILIMSIAFLQDKKGIELRDNRFNNKMLKSSYIAVFLIASIFIIISLPYEMVYNYANYKEMHGTRSSYNSLRFMDKYPIKDNRYYIKLGNIESDRYNEIGQKELLTDSIESLNKYISLEKEDARALEVLSAAYFKSGDIDKGEETLKKLIDLRPFYPDSYSKLADLYYYNIKEAVNKRDVGSIEKSLAKFDYIKNKLISVLKVKSYGSKYMNNQLNDTIDSNHEQVFKDIEDIRKYYTNINK